MHDLIIIGGAVAATSAGVYAARRGLNFKIITTEFGGEVATSGEIENWPGIIHTTGVELAGDFKKHLEANNVEIEEGITVSTIEKAEDGTFVIIAKNMSDEEVRYECRTVLITTGVHPRHLEIPGEEEFRGKGVTYCTTCDGPLFRDKVVATIGGGNSALESALMLNEIASKVYLINKNAEFKGDTVLIENIKKAENVEIIYNADTTEISGEQFVTGMKYKDADDAEQSLEVQGIFVHIGMIPNSDIVDFVEKDEFKQIIVNDTGETNVPGLFAAGDVTNIPYKQIAIAAGQGVSASLKIIEYLNKS